MGGCNYDEKQLKAALHAAADSCDPPAGMKQRIDAQLAWQVKKEDKFMRKMSMKKTAVAAVMACALTGTVCMAAVKMSGYSTGFSSSLKESRSFTDVNKYEQKADVDVNEQEAFANGFTFAKVNIINGQDFDEKGNETDSYKEMHITYEKGEKDISLNVKKGERVFTDTDLACMQAVEADGVTYYFRQDNYLFVPEGYEPTEAEAAAEAEGKLIISIGSEEREENVMTHLSWNADGQYCSLFGADLEMSADELVEMAQQMK